MSYCNPIGAAGLRPIMATRPQARQAAASGFRVTQAAAQGPAAVSVVGLTDLLALQEAEQDTVRDREARRHGDATLAALASMQRALLGGSREGVMETLTRLARNAPEAADPRLLAVQRALQVRVAVELARTRGATPA